MGRHKRNFRGNLLVSPLVYGSNASRSGFHQEHKDHRGY